MSSDFLLLTSSSSSPSFQPRAAEEAITFSHKHLTRESIIEGVRREDRWSVPLVPIRDLRRYLAEWQSHGRIDPFPLGAHDASDRLRIPEKLYGREREIDAMLAALDRVVAHGTPEFVPVSGYSGVGKSSVVNELHKALVPPRGLFASGKFDQYKRDIPYATLAQAFQTLIRQILAKTDAEVVSWRQSLQEALGPNGQLIVNLIPEVEFIIGKQSPVLDLSSQDARSRFQSVFRRFLAAFARPEHLLVLFLDDLQWLDAYSRRVIGWALDRTMENDLTLTALRMALSRRAVGPGLVHHSDRGSQSASNEYTDLLKANGIDISMSRKGNPWDNAACESFMKTLKYEEVLRNEYRDLAYARTSLREFLEKIYNQKRLHSSPGYMPPARFEANQRMPRRGTFPYEFSKAWENLSIRWGRQPCGQLPHSSSG